MSDDIGTWLTQFSELNPEDVSEDEGKSGKTYKLDMFKVVLPAIDRGDKYFFSKLTPEEQDSIEPWLLMRWLTSSTEIQNQAHYLLSVNDFVNVDFSRLTAKKTLGIVGHKELQWMLMSLCGTGKTPMRSFMKPAKGFVKNKIEEALLKLNPLMKVSDLALIQQINSTEDFEEYFRDNGYTDNEIFDIFGDLSKRKK